MGTTGTVLWALVFLLGPIALLVFEADRLPLVVLGLAWLLVGAVLRPFTRAEA